MKTYVFPGQGSQARGMGEPLFDRYSDLVDKADNVLGYSIKELCLKDPRRELHKTQFTQPALYVVNALSYYSKVEETGSEPDFVAGHSLGEYNALLAAECFDFETGLKLVKERGALMSEATGGGMAAILNASKEEIERILRDNGLDNIDIANFNTFSQIVISGSREEIGKAEPFFQNNGEMLYYPLNTSGAFHSRYMEPSRDKFAAYLKEFTFSPPKIPVISNVTAQPYSGGDIVENLSNQIASSVRWSESLLYVLRQGAEKGVDMAIEEVGHGDVLTKIIAKIMEETAETIREIKATAVDNLDSGEARQSSEHSGGSAGDPSAASPPTNGEASDTGAGSSPAGWTAPGVSAEEKVAAWNRQYPVGTRVKSTVMDYDDLETRTEAVVLFGHRAAVYMKDYNGYFDLDEIQPA